LNPIRVKNLLTLYFPPIAVYGIIFYFSSQGASSLPGNIPDIIPHFGEYFWLSFFFVRIFKKPITPRIAALSAGVLFFLAFLDELHQYFVPTRFFTLSDLAADALGIVVGIIVYKWLSGKPA